MAAVDDILQSLPLDRLAQQVGADPQEVQQAAQAALPALLGGLQANAQDPGGASSIVEALGQHDDDLLQGGVDLDQVDQQDGEKIASHIFGSNEEQVYSALGSSSSASGGLIRRLIPILAPIVLSYLANKVLKGGGGLGGGGTTPQTSPDNSAQGGPGSLDSMLQDVLGGALGGGTATQQAPAPTQQTQGSAGGSIIDILGGLLGGGRR
ncbi:hypothetical protein N798_17220 [Knoellia flava TL1]|uniref:DUF937 domain-containing protein n=2 Tax=Knoellia flava TaxID=913969 RepID=A0A8H9FVB1_9MICO|nr:DUF937 domain-containing protein [Knoellia flava]KGN28784.1 hypothetical protein N798_17220 [Knoellia flava TL1]GGB85523.1 hypothetical protein GCM10011314_26540 [Knoellia flava]